MDEWKGEGVRKVTAFFPPHILRLLVVSLIPAAATVAALDELGRPDLKLHLVSLWRQQDVICLSPGSLAAVAVWLFWCAVIIFPRVCLYWKSSYDIKSILDKGASE